MFILEGNIGAGKSTFLKLIRQYMPDISIGLEPLHNWQSHVAGQSLLANFMQDPQRWSYTMETFAMICRVQEHLKDQAHGMGPLIIERSIYSGHYCFALNGYRAGFMSDLEWKMYNEFFSFLIPTRCLVPQGFIYLSVNPEIAYTRIKKRNRDAEKSISLEYLSQIHECHEDFLLHKRHAIAPEIAHIPVLVLDCNEEFETNSHILHKHFEKVRSFVMTSPVSYKNDSAGLAV